jgi:hypothetical protein
MGRMIVDSPVRLNEHAVDRAKNSERPGRRR